MHDLLSMIYLISFSATLLKLTLFDGCFSRFLNCTNATKSRNAPHIFTAKFFKKNTYNPAVNCMFKVNNKNTRTRCETCSKLTLRTPKRRHWRCSGVFVCSSVFIGNFEQVNAGWEISYSQIVTIYKNESKIASKIFKILTKLQIKEILKTQF